MLDGGYAVADRDDNSYPLIRNLPKSGGPESKSALRALNVLEYFSIVKRPVRARTIADVYGLHPSSAAQLLKTMSNAGYLVFDPIRKLYYPSPRLNRFAVWLTSGCFWNVDTNTVLEELSARTRSNVSLSVRNGNSMQVIDAVMISFINPTGSSIPFDSVHGQAFLATCPDQEVTRIVERAALFRQLSDTSAEWLYERVRAARTGGYAIGRSVDEKSWTIAIALPLSHAPNVVVLGVTDTPERIKAEREEILAIMREGAADLCQADGVSPRSEGPP